ncbi:helix-turn-helix transcriptional regulator [Nitrospira lenta]|nr:AraC family transcriptional regulator [Nitrospira lenta]
MLTGRIHTLTAELSRYAPQWADRLAQVKSERELLEVVSSLFNLAHILKPEDEDTAPPQPSLPTRIHKFMTDNLHRGLTLKLLSQFLGYSEKYCSDLFHSTMGESFSAHLKRRRLEIASRLLETTDKGVAEIATVIGFCDQFAFSHFFKRATGQSPIQFRSERSRRLSKPRPGPARNPS